MLDETYVARLGCRQFGYNIFIKFSVVERIIIHNFHYFLSNSLIFFKHKQIF